MKWSGGEDAETKDRSGKREMHEGNEDDDDDVVEL